MRAIASNHCRLYVKVTKMIISKFSDHLGIIFFFFYFFFSHWFVTLPSGPLIELWHANPIYSLNDCLHILFSCNEERNETIVIKWR